MTEALKKALTAIRHLRGDRVFFQRDGSAVDETTMRAGWSAPSGKRDSR